MKSDLTMRKTIARVSVVKMPDITPHQPPVASPSPPTDPLSDLSDRARPDSILSSLLRSLSNKVIGAIRLIERINNRAGELPRGSLLREQNVELVVRAVPGLGQTEEAPDEHAQAGAAPDEAGVALEVPGLRVHHELLEGAADEACDVGAVASEADGLLSEATLREAHPWIKLTPFRCSSQTMEIREDTKPRED